MGPKYFCMFLNFSQKLNGRGTRARYFGDYYQVVDGVESRFYCTKSRVIHSIGGFKQRNNTLISAYQIDRLYCPKNEDLVIDIGANAGDFCLAVRSKWGYDFTYLGFEPNPADFSILQLNLKEKSNNLVSDKCISDKVEERDFWVAMESASSSIIEPPAWDMKVKLVSVTLDSQLAQFDSRVIHLLKVEAEGAEPEVLLGALRCLKRTRFVTIDVGPERGLQQLPTLDMCRKIMEQNGFRLLNFRSGHRQTALFENLQRI